MPKHSGIVAHFDDAQITKTFHRLHDDDWAYETVQDCDPIIDANKEAQNHCDPRTFTGDMRMTHRIPLIFFEKWKRELGVDYWDPNHQEAVDRLLSSSDYRWLSVDGKRNHNVSLSGINIGKEMPLLQAPKVSKTAVLASDGTPMAAH